MPTAGFNEKLHKVICERLQEVTRGYRRLQEVTGGYRRLQEVTGEAKNNLTC